MTKIEIKNRKGQKLTIIVDENLQPKGLAIVMHGLGGFKDQKHIVAFAESFKNKDFTVVRFDTTNSFGESGGNYEDATVTNYYEDLEDVIAWVKTQPWYREPFYLAGHSLGSMCIVLYSEKYPQEIKGLAPISTAVSGKLSIEVNDKEYLEKWKKTGWREEKSESIPGLIKRLKWSHIVDRLKYDVLLNAEKLVMPVILIVGDKDERTPLRHQKILFDKLPGEKELHVIKDADHNFRGNDYQGNLAQVERILSTWIEKVESENSTSKGQR